MAESMVTARTFRFLRDLARNNDREWFHANKQRYLDDVRDPLLRFIARVGPGLARISPQVSADPSPVGGSLFRIHRDTRFSIDKRPYKTAAAMVFPLGRGHRRGPGGPVFYLNLEPGGIFMGAGIWRPEADTLQRVRDAIVADPKGWRRVLASPGVELDEGEDDDRLKRPPRGYDPEHPLIEDLKRKRFTASAPFTERQACAANFPAAFVAACRRKAPLMQFLAHAAGVPW